MTETRAALSPQRYGRRSPDADGVGNKGLVQQPRPSWRSSALLGPGASTRSSDVNAAVGLQSLLN
jgi:hypothetical protein